MTDKKICELIAMYGEFNGKCGLGGGAKKLHDRQCFRFFSLFSLFSLLSAIDGIWLVPCGGVLLGCGPPSMARRIALKYQWLFLHL